MFSAVLCILDSQSSGGLDCGCHSPCDTTTHPLDLQDLVNYIIPVVTSPVRHGGAKPYVVIVLEDQSGEIFPAFMISVGGDY